MTLTERQRLALEQAASGHVSGSLWEWPELRSALAAVGVDADLDAPLTVMRALAKSALAALGDEKKALGSF